MTSILPIPSLLKAAVTAAIFTGFAAPTMALTLSVPKAAPEFAQTDMNLFEDDVVSNGATATLGAATPIAIARIDQGRMIATPYTEADDWAALSQSLTQPIVSLSPAAYLRAVPEIDMDGQDTDNKIDEIRLAAVDSGYPYILIYGVGTDAHFASFGGRSLRETGLNVPVGSQSWQGGDAKALLVDSYTGEVIDAVTTWAPDMPSLTAEVKAMIEALSPTA